MSYWIKRKVTGRNKEYIFSIDGLDMFRVRYRQDDTFLIAFVGDNINRDHWHRANDQTLLAFKIDRKYIYNRRRTREFIRDLTGIDMDLEWSPVDANALQLIKRDVSECERMAKVSIKWHDTRQYFIQVQAKLKEAKIGNDNYKKLRERMNKAFELLGKRQDAAKKKYQEECRKNYYALVPKVRQCESDSYTATSWRETREKFKHVKTLFKGKKLLKKQREELWKKMDDAFDRLWKRQQKARQDYEAECNRNYSYLRSKVDDCYHLAHNTTDWKEARQRFKDTQSEFRGRKLTKDQREKLRNSMNKAFQTLNFRSQQAYELRQRERAHKHAEWQARLRERVSRLRQSIDRIESSLSRDHDSLKYQNQKLYNVRPGRREYEIKSNIRDKISSIEARIISKRDKLESMRTSLRELQRKLD